MEIEIMNATNEGLYLSLLTIIEFTALLSAFLAIAGFAIYLAGVAWLCLGERRQSARRRTEPAPPEPDEYELLAVLAVLDNGLDNELTCGAARREGALQQTSIK